jgi:hypothetical protein
MSRKGCRYSLPLVLGAPLFLFLHIASAAELMPGNLLVGVSASYASGNQLREYTPDGALVQSVEVPYPVPPRPSSECVRDIVVTPAEQVSIYNGTFYPYMTRWTPKTGEWSHDTYEGWDSSGNESYGGIAAWQNYVYATDMVTSGEPPSDKGLIRFNVADGTAARYFDYAEFIDVAIGFDGALYALRTDEHGVYVIEPQTMTVQRSFQVTAAVRGIAVNGAGEVFGASWDGNLYEFDSLGNTLNTIDPQVGSLIDVDLAADGTLVAGTREGWVVVSDETLQSVSTFRATYYLPTFVSFTTPVPEPLSLTALLLGFAFVGRRGRSI